MATQTFPAIEPSRSSGGETTNFRVARADFGDGYRQSSVDGLNAQVNSWELTWAGLLNADVLTVTDFLDLHAGATPFYWTPPGESAALLWTCAGYQTTPTGPYAGRVVATFERWYGVAP